MDNSEYLRLALRTMKSKGVVGIRHIINYEPSWPKVLEDYSISEIWARNLSILRDYGMTFDLHCNPH